ncbi:MAG TPA: DUF1080 domain-containing protein [Tepidisphaeraceae bacterium]|nr:DUF1080 domain-containing protein [Tepidisphaeraceae bacterium]
MRLKSFAFCLIAVLSTATFAADAPTTQPLDKPGADGFISLFNGKDLSGWEGMDGYWSVKDGAITGSQTKENAKHTFLVLKASKAWPDQFANFELHLKYKWMSDTGDSGIQIRSKMVPDTRDPSNLYKVGGYQINTVPKRTYDGGLYDEAGQAGGRGIMSQRGFKTIWDKDNKRTNEPLPQTAEQLLAFVNQPNGEFNDLVFVANGGHLTITINGHLMGDVIDESPKAVLHGGLIALQMHMGQAMTIQFKDIKIKLLDAPMN